MYVLMLKRIQPYNLESSRQEMMHLNRLDQLRLLVLLERTKVKEQQQLPSRNVLSSFSAPYFGWII
jgi:hypothetical protein